MPELANVNGRICPADEAVVPAEDRGCLFGDGVYEVLRTYNGRMWAFERHFARLRNSLREIELSGANLDQIKNWIRQTYAESQIADATVYYHITRGSGPRSHVWKDGLAPTFFMTVRRFASRGDGHHQGVRVWAVPDQRWARCDIKSLNLLPNVLAKQQARARGAYEALLVSREGLVTEGTSSSIIAFTKGALTYPANSAAILPSITRQYVIEMAAELNIPVREQSLSLEEFRSADEAFLAGTGDEIMGITHVNNQRIADGKVGDLTRKFYQRYKERIADNSD